MIRNPDLDAIRLLIGAGWKDTGDTKIQQLQKDHKGNIRFERFGNLTKNEVFFDKNSRSWKNGLFGSW